jgi:endonuclease/exonuclease/phosphatase family metal-dependent hydrolase
MQTAVAPPRAIIATLTLVLAATAILATAPGADAKPKKKGQVVKVMTRNLFLGADLGPALGSSGPGEFIVANGEILREVTETDFPRRSGALAAEIRDKAPDLVGLQEVALWREDEIASLDPVFPPGGGPPQPQATDVRYDFLKLLMDKVNRGKKRYKVAFVQKEFDFEAPGDENEIPDDGEIPNVPEVPELNDAELNGRLTMRDAILVKKSKRIDIRRKRGGNFNNLLEVTVGGVVTIPVTRGWASLEAKVGRSGWFKFTDTHFEAFDDGTETPSIRQLQATELGEPGGYADSRRPTVLVGDLNSDDNTVAANDQKAYNALLGFGWRPRSTENPMSCCVPDLFTSPPSEFDHHIDHVMTNSPKQVKLLSSSVTGRQQVNGIYPSDHAGVFSKLRIKPKRR